jgi:hypothetical protein
MTADGRLTTAQITPGTVILVERNTDGQLMPTRRPARHKNVITVEVDGKDLVNVPHGAQRRYVVFTKCGQRLAPATGAQTFSVGDPADLVEVPAAPATGDPAPAGRCVHTPGEIGCPSTVLTCNGIPSDAAGITAHPSTRLIQPAPITGETGVMTIGRAMRTELSGRHTVAPVALLAHSDPYGRGNVRDFTVWQYVADGYRLTVVKYDGQPGPLVPTGDYVAVFARETLIVGHISAAQNPHELAYQVARVFRYWLADQAHNEGPGNAPVPGAVATITHTATDGTIITGVDGPDGQRAGLGRPDSFNMTARTWHWVAGAGVWVLSRSVDTRPMTSTIETAREQLQRAGYTVTVSVADHDIMPVTTPSNPVPDGGDTLTLPDDGDQGGNGGVALVGPKPTDQGPPAPALTTVPERGGVERGPVVVALVSHVDISDPAPAPAVAGPDDSDQDAGSDSAETSGSVALAPVLTLPAPADGDQVDPATVRDILSRCTWSTESIRRGRRASSVIADVLQLPRGERIARPVFVAVADQVRALGGGKWVKGTGWPFEPSRMVWDPKAPAGGRHTPSGRDVLAAWLDSDQASAAPSQLEVLATVDQVAPAVALPAVPNPLEVPAGLPYVADMPADWPGTPRRLEAKDVAKILRTEVLPAWFPGVKFSVRTSSASMITEVTAYWEDGPAADFVRLIVDQWRGKSYDGMSESTTYRGPVLYVNATGEAEAIDLGGVCTGDSRRTTDRAALAALHLLDGYGETLSHSEFRDPYGRPYYGGSRSDAAGWLASMGADEWTRTSRFDKRPSCPVGRCQLADEHPFQPLHRDDMGHAFIGTLPDDNGDQGGNGGVEPTGPQPTDQGPHAPAVDQASGDQAPAAPGFGSWSELAEHITGRPAVVEQAAPVATVPALRLVTVTNDARGNIRVHATDCRDIGRDSAGGGVHWDVRTYDVRGVVLDLYDDANGENWQDFAGDIRVMPCAGELPDVAGQDVAGREVPREDVPAPAVWVDGPYGQRVGAGGAPVRLVTVTNDSAGDWRIHRPGCRDIAGDVAGGGCEWNFKTADVATVVIDTYGDATREDWRGCANPRVMPCVGKLPDSVDLVDAPAGDPDKASAPADHGYICKACGEPSPVGVGYVADGAAAGQRSAGLTACECGHSRTATADQVAAPATAAADTLWDAYQAARAAAETADGPAPVRPDNRPRVETFRGRQLRTARGKEWGTIVLSVNGQTAGSVSGSDPAALDRAAVQLRRDVVAADERRITDPDAYPAEWFRGAPEPHPDVVAYRLHCAEQDRADRAAIFAPPAVTPHYGDQVTVSGWSVSGFVLGVVADRVAVDVSGEISRVPLHMIMGVETLTGGESTAYARQRLTDPVPEDLYEFVRIMAGRHLWTTGKPEGGMLVAVPSLHDTAGKRREGVEMLAEKVTHLGCGCFRIECYRPGPVDPTEGGYRRWVNFLTGCSWHETMVTAPAPTVEEIATAEGVGRQSCREGIPVDAPGEAPEVTALARRYPVGSGAADIRAAYRRGYADAAERAAAEAVDLVANAERDAATAQELADRVPAAQECADIQRHGAESLALTLATRTATAEQARKRTGITTSFECPAHGTVPVPVDIDGSDARAIVQRHQPCTAGDPFGMTAVERESTPTGQLTSTLSAAGWTAEDIDRAIARITIRPWVTAHLTDDQRAELTAPESAGQEDSPAETETSGSVAVTGVAATHPAPDGRMVKRPPVGAYIHTDAHGVCEVTAVHGRSGEAVAARNAAGERLSLTRPIRSTWLVVPAPAGDQVDTGSTDDAPAGGEPGGIYRLPVAAYAPELASDDNGDILISHNHAAGTTIDGSRPGDGVLEIAQRHRFVWRRGAGIHIPHSRDRFADLDTIGKLAAALREAGHTVAVEIDDVWRPAAEREDARAERAEARAERLGERASQQFEEAHARRMASRRISDGMPFGEPIKVGHHSERAHRRAFDRIAANDRASYAARDYAEYLAGRAEGAERNEQAKQQPRAIMRRIDRLEADRRDWLRRLADTDKGTTGYARRCRLHLEQLAEDIAFQQAKLGAMAETGAFVAWSKDSIRKGDLVNVGGRWCEVTRVNRKGVSVSARFEWQTGMSGPVEWHEIYGRRRDGEQLDMPGGTPWPVVDAKRVERWAALVSRYETCTSYDRTDEELIKRARVAQARRIVLGLDVKASAQEVAAYGEPETVEGRRVRALASLAVFERLEAGERVADVVASVIPVGDTVPAWTMPAGETVDVLPRDLVAGDVVAGVWDTFASMRTLSTAIVGPVESAPRREERREAGDWYHVTINGEARELRSSRWLAVHRTGQR